MMAWEEDSITRLEQQSYTSFPDSDASNNLNGEAPASKPDTSDLSSDDDEKYEAFSLSASRRSSSVDISFDKKKDDANADNIQRRSWWPFGARDASGDENISWGDDNANNHTDSSEELQLQTKELSELSSAVQDSESRPSGWWQLQFRRKSILERSNSEHSSSNSAWGKSSHGAKSDGDNNAEENNPQDEELLNELLFPRRGKSSRQSFLTKRRTSHGSAQSTLKGSVFSHDSNQSKMRHHRSSITSINDASSQISNSLRSMDQQEDVEQVLSRHSMNLGSIERALLADLVTPHENRWKRQSVAKTTLYDVQRMASAIPEEDQSSCSENSKKDKTVETMMETQMSPTSDLLKPSDGESISSGEVHSDGLYSAWSVPSGPQDRNVEPDTLPTIGGWDTEAMLELKNGISLSRTHEIDDVSSIASSVHSGNIVSSKSLARMSYRRKGDMNKLSIVSTLNSWRGSTISKSRISSRAHVLMNEYEEEEDDTLEDEVFAMEDARHAKVVKEAMQLMDSVNKSVVGMGMEAPFRKMDEICPPFKKLHKNVLHQLKELDAVSLTDQEKLLRVSVHTAKLQQFKEESFKGSFTTNTSELSGISEAPSLDDRKAVAAFIMNRIASYETASVAKQSCAESKTHTAYLPNFLYYQFIAADKDSIIKPTSLCSGTGITGGDQFLKPDMLNMFGMFGSYLAGSAHLFQDEDSEDDKPARSTFYMEPIHEDESLAGSNATSNGSADSDDELLISARSPAPGAQLSIELLESIISELKQGQIQEMPKFVMSPGIEKRPTSDNSDLPSLNHDTQNIRAVSSLPAMLELNTNLPDQSIINELKRGQREMLNCAPEQRLEHRQMGYY